MLAQAKLDALRVCEIETAGTCSCLLCSSLAWAESLSRNPSLWPSRSLCSLLWMRRGSYRLGRMVVSERVQGDAGVHGNSVSFRRWVFGFLSASAFAHKTHPDLSRAAQDDREKVGRGKGSLPEGRKDDHLVNTGSSQQFTLQPVMQQFVDVQCNTAESSHAVSRSAKPIPACPVPASTYVSRLLGAMRRARHGFFANSATTA